MYQARHKIVLTNVDLSNSTTVAASGGTNNQVLQPPAGKIYKVRSIFYNCPAPAGATAGTHAIKLRQAVGSISDFRDFASITSNFGTAIYIFGDDCFTGTTELPSNAVQQYELIHYGVIMCSDTHPIQCQYLNSTDANQTGTRILYFLVEMVD